MKFFKKLRAFKKEEDGVITVEFVLLLPMILALTFWVIEIGVLSMRWVVLENSLDKTVRDIRITNFVASHTGAKAQHDAIKDRICSYASTINDCDSYLKLELIPSNPSTGAPDTDISCVDKAVDPDTTTDDDYLVTVGNPEGVGASQIMFIRACVLIDPIVPPAFAKPILESHSPGVEVTEYALVSTNAFILEP